MLLRLLVLSVLPGCMLFRCGDFELSGMTALSAQGEEYDGRWHETCTASMGTSGVWEWEAGWSEIWFFPSASGSRDWQALDIDIVVGLPTASLTDGAEIPIEDLYGSAVLRPCLDCYEDAAVLTEGTIQVKSGPGEDEGCEGDGPEHRIEWDLVYGDGSGPTYELHGNDRILFSNFTTDACSSW
jgi:hypothetical protein